jgi:hypothetical protein
MEPLVVVLLFTILIIGLLAFIAHSQSNKIDRLNDEVFKWKVESKKSNESNEGVNTILKSDLEVANKRIKELEDGVASEYGVPVRKIVEELKCDFDKNEMLFISEGIKKVIQKPTNTLYDIEYYTALWKKVDEMYKKLPDVEPEKEEEEKEDGKAS